MEVVVLTTDSELRTSFQASDSESSDPGQRDQHPVSEIQDLSPYGLLLASLGACTAILLFSFARNHRVPLSEVTMRLTYARLFAAACQNCEKSGPYTERIDAEVLLKGDLPPAERDKLFLIAKHCPVHKILHNGIETEFHLAQG
jgi:putative redox protein